MSDQSIATIIDLLKKVSVDSTFSIKTPKELLSDKDYNLVAEAFTVITKYRNTDWMSEISESEIQSDIIYLQCTIIFLAEKLSLASSYQDTEEDKIKTARSKVRLALKQVKQDLEKTMVVKVTADDLKDAALALTENLASKYEDLKVGANFIKYVFYAIRDHVQYLDKALTRMYALIPEKIKAQEMHNEPRNSRSTIFVSGSPGATE